MDLSVINKLVLMRGQPGFPNLLTLNEHQRDPDFAKQFLGDRYEVIREPKGLIVYNDAYLVEEIGERELYWGTIDISGQEVEDGLHKLAYQIKSIFKPDFQRQITTALSSPEKNFFEIPRENIAYHLNDN